MQSEALLLDKKSVDALYDLLSIVLDCCSELQLPLVLISGSCLGSVRSRSILFCDDDVDVALVGAECYERALKELPPLLQKRNCCFVVRPWPAADRIRLNSWPSVWIDVFVLRRYGSLQEIRAVVSVKENGAPQTQQYIDAALAPVVPIQFPLWHYDHRKAIELYPREFFREKELFPIRFDLSFGPLAKVPMPARPVPYLRRSYGANVFDVYCLAESHLKWSKEIQQRFEARKKTDKSLPEPGMETKLEDVMREKERDRERERKI